MPQDRRRRVGPLSAVSAPEPALALGDTAVHHVRLGTLGVTLHGGDAPSSFVPWAGIREIQADTPTTWWPHPGVGDTVVAIIEGLLGGSASEASETPTFAVRVLIADGETLEWRATTHYLSGYRRRDAALAAGLLDHLVSRADARVLLARPTALLERVDQILPSPRSER